MDEGRRSDGVLDATDRRGKGSRDRAAAYPSTIAPHKSWFGVFAGKLKGVPGDRVLRIGFGEFSHGDPNKPETHPFSFFAYATLHEFKLPRV